MTIKVHRIPTSRNWRQLSYFEYLNSLLNGTQNRIYSFVAVYKVVINQAGQYENSNAEGWANRPYFKSVKKIENVEVALGEIRECTGLAYQRSGMARISRGLAFSIFSF